MAKSPQSLSIRTYNVGFGDCFLLSFKYTDGERHVLVDFGTKKLPPDAPRTRMMDIAQDVKSRSAGKLTAVVATHRHQDHISGFTTKDGKASGDIIRKLKPDLVVQPWTEDPKLAKDAKGPSDNQDVHHVRALAAMHAVAQSLSDEASRRRSAGPAKAELQFIGEDNISNVEAVRNLATMGAKNEYLFCGAPTGLGKLLPGVTVDVLGPPTVRQHAAVVNERSEDPSQFWQFQARAAAAFSAAQGKPAPLFPRYVSSRGPNFPADTRWFIYHSLAARDDESLRIVRALDDAMNNTSVILLMRIGKKTLLFPGDAQIENWEYALGQSQYKSLLKEVTLYKVGHHGSRNATPKTLWDLFQNRSTGSTKRMASLMSTLHGVYGREDQKTEVPRRTLKTALQKETDLFTTEDLKGRGFWKDSLITF